MTITTYNNDKHRNSVITLWQTVFGYPDKRNNPDLVIQKKLSVDNMLYVALEDGTVIGTVMAGYDGHRGWIYSLAVAPAFRKRGVATELLCHSEQALAAKGCMKINLQILDSNEQVKDFYLKNGYSIEARVSMEKQIPENIPEQGSAQQMKQSILQNLCYTDLVYSRINKKLGTYLSRTDIEVLIHDALTGTGVNDIIRIGKNYYATCNKHNMRITINSRTFRVITVDKIVQKKGDR